MTIPEEMAQPGGYEQIIRAEDIHQLVEIIPADILDTPGIINVIAQTRFACAWSRIPFPRPVGIMWAIREDVPVHIPPERMREIIQVYDEGGTVLVLAYGESRFEKARAIIGGMLRPPEGSA